MAFRTLLGSEVAAGRALLSGDLFAQVWGTLSRTSRGSVANSEVLPLCMETDRITPKEVLRQGNQGGVTSEYGWLCGTTRR